MMMTCSRSKSYGDLTRRTKGSEDEGVREQRGEGRTPFDAQREQTSSSSHASTHARTHTLARTSSCPRHTTRHNEA